MGRGVSRGVGVISDTIRVHQTRFSIKWECCLTNIEFFMPVISNICSYLAIILYTNLIVNMIMVLRRCTHYLFIIVVAVNSTLLTINAGDYIFYTDWAWTSFGIFNIADFDVSCRCNILSHLYGYSYVLRDSLHNCMR